MTEEREKLPFVAFHPDRLPEDLPALEPAPRWRDWMETWRNRWPTRCLPLLMADESGWVLRAPHRISIQWEGGGDQSALAIEQEGALVSSQFGRGIATFDVPFLFRTPPGWELLVRGPANSPKDGIGALEGLVETDWSAAPFTMNWQMTRPGHEVVFEAGEPYCQIVPMRRWDLERFEPEMRSVATEEQLSVETAQHSRERAAAKALRAGTALLGHEDTSWEGKYFRGTSPLGDAAPEHRTKRRLRPFAGR